MTTLLHYRIVDQRTRQPVDTLELHVLARAYHAAWQAVHKDSPQGVHHLPKLHTDVEFFRPTRRGGEKGLANNVPSAIQRARTKRANE